MTKRLHVLLAFNEPLQSADSAHAAAEAGVLDSVVAIEAAARLAGHDAQRLGLTSDLTPLLDRLKSDPPDVVFNLVESFAGRPELEPHIAGIFEAFEVPYTGSSAECLGLVRNKALTKVLLRGAGVPTADAWVVEPEREILREVFAGLQAGPLFVKPACSDASEGVVLESVVEDEPALVAQVARVHRQFGTALVERFIDGREFNVGIIDLGEPLVLPLAEMEFVVSAELPWRVITYHAKWTPDSPEDKRTQVRCPADVEPELGEKIRNVALAAYGATGCRDYARVDIRVDAAGRPFVLEINANPDLDPLVGLARELRAGGWTYDMFIGRLIEHAAQRRPVAKPPVAPRRHAENRAAAANHANGRSDKATILRPLMHNDIDSLVEMTHATKVFRPDEVAVARELMVEALADPLDLDGYRVIVAAQGDRCVGWSCHGRIPLTDGSFDLYWIVVDPQLHGRKIGRQLLDAVEAEVRRHRGRWLFADTSSLPSYDATRQFYVRTGFQIVRESPDFYRAGDGLVVFGKRLD